MTDEDAILVRVLAAQDAPRFPLRDWGGHAATNRLLWLERGGVPFRAQAADEARRKVGERTLNKLAAAGLITVGKSPRVKFPLVALTPAGEFRAQALARLPWEPNGWLFLDRVAEAAPRFVTGWVPEIELNGGKGWGEDATAADREGLSRLEMEYLPAAARGWVRANSTILGHAGYRVTDAGWAELKAEAPELDYGPPPPEDPEAYPLYRREQDAFLEMMRSEMPSDPKEIGELPLSAGGDFEPARPSRKKSKKPS